VGAHRRGGGDLKARWAPDDGVGRVLVVAAHPDDIDFGAAGTVAAFTEAGLDVAYCIATDGDAGGDDRAVSRSDMAEVRRQEQRAAADVLGVRDLTFLGYPDGKVAPTLELRRDLSRVIRRYRPQRVVAPSPERWWERIQASHPDHLAVGEAAVCAVYPDARNPFAHPELLAEGLEPHTVDELWLMASPRASVVVDVTATFDRKLQALRCHESQISGAEALDARLRQWAGAVAIEAGLPDGALGEAFQRVATG
jgi:LmbE family N-acetylglucosaminyl deacetylase